MTIKQLIDKHGGVPAFRRFLEKRKNIYKQIPSFANLYKHYRGQKPKRLRLKDLYKDLGVTEL